MEPLEYDDATTFHEEPVPHVGLTGTKNIAGETGIYEYRLFRFPESFALAGVGSRSANPEPPDVVRFRSGSRAFR